MRGHLRWQYACLVGVPYKDTEELTERSMLMCVQKFSCEQREQALLAADQAWFYYFSRP